jgi:hypothetical protein
MSADKKMRMKDIATFTYRDRPLTVGIIRGNGIEKIHPLVDIWRTAEAFAAEQGKKVKVVSPPVADHLLVATDKARIMANCEPFPVDGIIAYGEMGRNLKAEIVFTPDTDSGSVVMVVPRTHRGKNKALGICGMSSRDFSVEGKDVKIEVPPDRIITIATYPYYDGWYAFHPDIIISYGEMKFGPECTDRKGKKDLRYHVGGYGPYVGPPFRHVLSNGTSGMEEILTNVTMDVGSRPSIVVELPGGDR